MRPILTAAVLGLTLMGGALAVAQQAAPSSAPPPASPPRLPGYLTDATAPDGYVILPPAPQKGTDRYSQDRRIFRATRKLEGSDRWTLAQNDVQLTTADLLRDFSCALGMTLTPDNAPKTTRLLARAARDSSRTNNSAKDQFKRLRPYYQDKGKTCTPRTEGLDKSFDYPSGHAQLGWMTGLLLAELAPERSTWIMVRARAYGESRVVCGVHNASAIEGARTNGSVAIAAMHGSAEFRAEADAARAELAALRGQASRPDEGICRAEWNTAVRTPYPY